MVKRIALLGVGCFFLLAAGAVECQSARSSSESLPDAPSASVSFQASNFQRVSEETSSSLSIAPVAAPASLAPATLRAETDLAHVTAGLRWSETTFNPAV